MKHEWKMEAAGLDGTTVDIQTSDGVMDCYIFHPAGNGKWPAVIFYMDGPGIRLSMFEMAQRMASNGYYVLLPNLFYRAGDYPDFDPKTVFGDPAERERLMSFVHSVTPTRVLGDTGAIMDFLKSGQNVFFERIGTVGYCMGGSMALRAAAAFPQNIKAAAAFHASRLATDQPQSPHLLAKQFKARLYIGVAGIDKGFSPEEKERLRKALEEGQARFIIEEYPGVAHGFSVPDMPVYDQHASERHWAKLLELFEEELKGSK